MVNAGKTCVEQVLYTAQDVFDDWVYVTQEGLQYAQDSLRRKRQGRLIAELSNLPKMIAKPEIVIIDSSSPDDTIIYYKRFYDQQSQKYRLMAVIVKQQGDLKFVYNVHLQHLGRVKGAKERPKPTILYLNPQRKARDFGL